MTSTTTTTEQWASPPSLKAPWIQVSTLGRVRSLEHSVEVAQKGVKPHLNVYRQRDRKTFLDSRGRPCVVLQGMPGRGKYAPLVHRLVAECFVRKPSGGWRIAFKNGDRSNVTVGNLKWLTRREWLDAHRDKVCSTVGCFSHRGDETPKFVCRGIGEAGERLNGFKQAVCSAISRGGKCGGYFVKYLNKGVYAQKGKAL